MAVQVEMQLRMRGPVVEGRTGPIMRRYTERAQDDIALQAGITVVQELQRVIKHPTPRYWTRIQVERAGHERLVTDGGIVYGPWLAGVGSRNRTTRFKGYQHWRRAVERMRRRAPLMATELLRRRYLPELNGGL